MWADEFGNNIFPTVLNWDEFVRDIHGLSRGTPHRRNNNWTNWNWIIWTIDDWYKRNSKNNRWNINHVVSDSSKQILSIKWDMLICFFFFSISRYNMYVRVMVHWVCIFFLSLLCRSRCSRRTIRQHISNMEKREVWNLIHHPLGKTDGSN
jgi:hypothetical protein